MDNLTLEHLAPYLPYGVELLHISHFHGNHVVKNWGIRNCGDYPVVEYRDSKSYGCTLSQVKPILRQISEINISFLKSNMDYDIIDFRINCEPEHHHFSVEVCDKVLGWSALSYEEYQLFFKNKFDVFGLIEKGLAVDINTLE